MRILWFSNAPYVSTGYGQQTAIWTQRLKASGHDVAVAAFHGLQGSPMTWNGITVYPGSPEDPFSVDFMLGHYQHHNADLMITLMDAWALDARLISLQQQGMKILHWQPVDTNPLSQLDERHLQESGVRPIAMSRHGEKMLKDFDPLYVPHGIDTSVFRPRQDIRDEVRARAGNEEKFVIGINAANQDPVRKGFGEQLVAFKMFHDVHPEARLLIHSRAQSVSGLDLPRIVANLGISDVVEFDHQYTLVTGRTTPDLMAGWYSLLDVFSNCSYGEGFGIPIIEAQACGVPVVVTDCSAMTELCGAGWLVEADPWWKQGHSAWWAKPLVKNIYEAYEKAYEARGTLGDKARQFAMNYDADRVLHEHWSPLLEGLNL